MGGKAAKPDRAQGADQLRVRHADFCHVLMLSTFASPRLPEGAGHAALGRSSLSSRGISLRSFSRFTRSWSASITSKA